MPGPTSRMDPAQQIIYAFFQRHFPRFMEGVRDLAERPGVFLVALDLADPASRALALEGGWRGEVSDGIALTVSSDRLDSGEEVSIRSFLDQPVRPGDVRVILHVGTTVGLGHLRADGLLMLHDSGQLGPAPLPGSVTRH